MSEDEDGTDGSLPRSMFGKEPGPWGNKLEGDWIVLEDEESESDNGCFPNLDVEGPPPSEE